MEDIRRKYNPKVDLSHPIKKKIEWSNSRNLQSNLLLYFIQSLIMLGLKKFRVVTNFFLRIKSYKFFKFIYNNNNNNFYHTFC